MKDMAKNAQKKVIRKERRRKVLRKKEKRKEVKRFMRDEEWGNEEGRNKGNMKVQIRLKEERRGKKERWENK